MTVLLKYWPQPLVMILILVLCSACTGMNRKELASDPVIKETERIAAFVSVERKEFFQLKNAYLSSRKAAYLDSMVAIMELMRDELERTEYFPKYHRYYRTGMDYHRWKQANDTFALCRDTLCEMMLSVGELQLRYGDQEYAAALFHAVVNGFDSAEIPGYVKEANRFLQEINENKRYAASNQAEVQRPFMKSSRK